jgi:hypothetical protein
MIERVDRGHGSATVASVTVMWQGLFFNPAVTTAIL